MSYFNQAWNCRVGVGDSVVCKDIDNKVHVVHDILRSSTKEGLSIVILKIGRKEIQTPIKSCIIVPTPKTMKYILEDKRKYEEYLKDIAVLEENYKLRPKKESNEQKTV